MTRKLDHHHGRKPCCNVDSRALSQLLDVFPRPGKRPTLTNLAKHVAAMSSPASLLKQQEARPEASPPKHLMNEFLQ